MPAARPARPSAEGAATVVARIHEALRTEILEGVLPPGTPLREESLAARFGASRHSVRSGVARLVRERLAVEVPYRGARVISLDTAEVVAMQQLRTALEVESVRLAAERHGGVFDDAAAAGLLAVLDGFAEPAAREEAGESIDWLDIERLHADFHRALVESSQSPRIIAAYAELSTELQLFLLQVRPHYGVRGLLDEHRRLVDELRARGGEAVRDHLAASTALLLDHAEPEAPGRPSRAAREHPPA